MRVLLVAAVLAAALAGVAVAELSASQKAAYIEAVREGVGETGVLGSVAASHFGQSIGTVLGQKSILSAEGLCAQALEKLGGPSSSLPALHHAAALAKSNKCTGVKLSADNKAKLNSGLRSLVLANLFHALSTASSLSENLEASNLEAIRQLLGAYPDKDAPSELAFRLMSFGKLHSLAGKAQRAEVQQAAKDLLVKAPKLLAEATSALRERFDVRAASMLVQGVFALARAAGESLETSDALAQLGQMLYERAASTQLSHMYYVLTGLFRLSKKKTNAPLVVSDVSSTIPATAAKFSFSVTGVFDRTLGQSATVTAESARAVDDDEAKRISLGAQASNLGRGQFEVDFQKAGLPAGRFEIALKIANGRAAPYSVYVPLIIASEGKFADVSLVVVKPQFQRDSYASAFPKQLEKNVQLSTMHNVTVTASVVDAHSGASLAPQQLFVRFAGAGGAESTFALKADAGTGRKTVYSARVVGTVIAEDFDHVSGEYTVELIAGDSGLFSPLRWNVGKAEFDFSERSPEAVSFPQFWGKRKEIHHVFPAPERRPPQFVSHVFALAAAAPVVLAVLAALFFVRPNMRLFPRDPMGAIAAIAFHAGLAACIAVILHYWVSASLMQTMPILMPVAGSTIVAGYIAMRSVNAQRAKLG